jgi:hypothetical protein
LTCGSALLLEKIREQNNLDSSKFMESVYMGILRGNFTEVERIKISMTFTPEALADMEQTLAEAAEATPATGPSR